MDVERGGVQTRDAATSGQARVTFEVLGSDGMKVSTDQVYEDSRSSGHYEVRFDGYNHPAGAGGFPMSIPPEKTTDERRRAYLTAQGLRPPIALFVTVLWVSDRTLVWMFHTYDLDASVRRQLLLPVGDNYSCRFLIGRGCDLPAAG